jgi:hypothetical protein
MFVSQKDFDALAERMQKQVREGIAASHLAHLEEIKKQFAKLDASIKIREDVDRANYNVALRYVEKQAFDDICTLMHLIEVDPKFKMVADHLKSVRKPQP